MTRAYEAIDKIRSEVTTDYAGHQPSAVELSRLRSSLHALRAAASHICDALPLSHCTPELLQAESAILLAATAEVQAFRRRHPLGRRAA
ncbi:hypothetical protein EOD42_02905 [Rhodovarius crocodyli]|uniref:Uncharacterized protein n=1 Tax=Rhodovarius crocodyli TaxID=1979269 RepID=A0A437MN81_9PROT|nr:hypothetical protein [Rhodovarius crocodyli]RVT99072.1 hypothetical protein EOD42_02905 [Rhodovarius crocodyli]